MEGDIGMTRIRVPGRDPSMAEKIYQILTDFMPEVQKEILIEVGGLLARDLKQECERRKIELETLSHQLELYEKISF